MQPNMLPRPPLPACRLKMDGPWKSAAQVVAYVRRGGAYLYPGLPVIVATFLELPEAFAVGIYVNGHDVSAEALEQPAGPPEVPAEE